MSWDNVLGNERIIPGGGGGNEVAFETDKPKRFRILFGEGNDQPYSYLEHCLEVEKIENGQVVKTFRTIRCPQTTKNPHANCPLCDGQQVRRRTRHAINVWDYDQNAVQKLNAGDSVFKPIATLRKMGVDITSVDWVVMKSGEGRNDTEYTTTNMGPTMVNGAIVPFVLPATASLYNLEADYAPHSVEDMKDIVEGAGAIWEKLLILPSLQFPTLAEALEHVMPNGKCKDQKFKDMWEADKSNRGMIYFLGMKSDRVSPEKAAAQVILANLGGIAIAGVTAGMSAPTNTGTTAPTGTTTGIQMQAPSAGATTPTPPKAEPISSGRQDKINKLNTIFSTKEKFTKGGFQVIIDTMKEASGGKTNIVDLTDVELDKLLVICEA